MPEVVRKGVGMWLIFGMFLFWMVVGSPRTAHACTCYESPLSEYADDVEAAFSGKQVRKVNRDSYDILVFEVERVFKGRVGPRFAVRTGHTSCGVDFEGEGVVGVVAYLLRGELFAGYCSSPAPISELVEVFGVGTGPDETVEMERVDHDLPLVPFLWIASITVLLLGVVAVLYRRQRKARIDDTGRILQ